MPEVRTIRYDDGRWCEQQYVDGKLHGTWTVFYANGQKEWERQHVKDRKEGYFRRWERTGRLIEEQWYHLNELHGYWRRWDQENQEKIVGDFFFGYPREVMDATVNPDFNTLIKPYFGLEPDDPQIMNDGLLSTLKSTSIRLKKMKVGLLGLSERVSFWNHVNILGVEEEWPQFGGLPLFPILQINCAELSLPQNPLSNFSFVTLFAAGDGVSNLGEDIVVRAYRREDDIVTVRPPCVPLESPSRLSLTDVITSFPDENDLPPGLKIHLEEMGDKEQVLEQDEKLSSRLGGWPGWVQGGWISSFGKFAFQIDSLDVENWDCGDCTIHYFFLDDTDSGFSWVQEMC
jgi:hypothetical protein